MSTPPTRSDASAFGPDDVPVPEPDAHPVAITEKPLPGEYGAHAFGRDLGALLAHRLAAPVAALIYRANPWERRRCPHAQFWDYSIGGHQIRVSNFEAAARHGRGTISTFAIHLDAQAVPFTRAPVDAVTLQLAYTIWSAHYDLPEHTHPISAPAPVA